MAAPEDVRSTRRLRRTIILTIGVAAAALGALLLTAGRASAEPVDVPGVGAVEIPDSLVPPLRAVLPAIAAPEFKASPGRIEFPKSEIPASSPVVAEMRFGVQPAIAHVIPLVTVAEEFAATPDSIPAPAPRAGIEPKSDSTPAAPVIELGLLPEFTVPFTDYSFEVAPGFFPPSTTDQRSAPGAGVERGSVPSFEAPSLESELLPELSKILPFAGVPGFTLPTDPDGASQEPKATDRSGTPNNSTPAPRTENLEGFAPNSGGTTTPDSGGTSTTPNPGGTSTAPNSGGTSATPNSGDSSTPNSATPGATTKKNDPSQPGGTTGPETGATPAAPNSAPAPGASTEPNPAAESPTPPNRGAPVSHEIRLGALPGFDGIVIDPKPLTSFIDSIGLTPAVRESVPRLWHLEPLGPAPLDRPEPRRASSTECRPCPQARSSIRSPPRRPAACTTKSVSRAVSSLQVARNRSLCQYRAYHSAFVIVAMRSVGRASADRDQAPARRGGPVLERAVHDVSRVDHRVSAPQRNGGRRGIGKRDDRERSPGIVGFIDTVR